MMERATRMHIGFWYVHNCKRNRVWGGTMGKVRFVEVL